MEMKKNPVEAGALGAKLTGAGFGGAVVALVLSAEETRFKEALTRFYPGLRVLG